MAWQCGLGGDAPRIDAPANGPKPPEIIHFPAGTPIPDHLKPTPPSDIMKTWKSFLPSAQSLSHISAIRPGAYFFDRKSDPKWSAIYFPQENGLWLSLSWDYFDVEFKFEIYGMSVGQLKGSGISLNEAGVIHDFSQIKFLLRTEWTRPTKPGEVPDSFEEIIEENGQLSQVPDTAASVATSLYGVIFSGHTEDPPMMITIDDAASYSLKSSTDPLEINAMERSCDLLTLPEILAWKPPQ
ncbi:hypothetical protein FHW69_003482 [Luteibacter sp. Sphag1AF]|uniref:hypothetical protein n=1 Tax=Luteibacter sp. Sphag1AF TaxID=2587031 RepID=UPI0016104CE1|nr:hypothetical protein [Luteibacter sp. Sphag1AF]MBB3228837.1 hypothetical protein [Luteibacter sp. Sphag1AF]